VSVRMEPTPPTPPTGPTGPHLQPCDRPSSCKPSSSCDRETTPRRLPEEPPCPRPGRTPLGVALFFDRREKEQRKTHRITDEEARKEAGRAAPVEQTKEKSPILTPDLHAILSLAEEDRIKRDLPAHTLRSFLINMQEQRHLPKAAHQNAAPQDHMEQDLHSHHGRSQGAPSSGHCQEGQQ